MTPIGTPVGGKPITVSQLCCMIRMAAEPRVEAFVGRGEEDEHHGGAGIDEPVRGGEELLCGGAHEVGRLLVRAVIPLLIRCDDDLVGATGTS
jgi:hypothetical protein